MHGKHRFLLKGMSASRRAEEGGSQEAGLAARAVLFCAHTSCVLLVRRWSRDIEV
jgi:hypothetical protein